MPNPDRVAETLQIGANIVRREFEKARYVLSDHPTRSKLGDQPRKLRP
jgi:hypothetical protein